MTGLRFQRGNVYAATLNEKIGEKYFLVVSNNSRNRHLGTALAVRLTTSAKPAISSIIDLPHGEPFTGRVLCDDIIELFPDEVRVGIGALSARTMKQVDLGLKSALGLA